MSQSAFKGRAKEGRSRRAKNRKAFVVVHYWGGRVACVCASTSKSYSAILASRFFRQWAATPSSKLRLLLH